MPGGTYTIYVKVDPSGAVTGLQTVKSELGSTQAAARETGTVFAGMFKFFAVAEVAHQLFEMADTFLQVESNIRVAGVAVENTGEVFNRLGEIANQTRAPIEGLSELYRQLGINAHSLGLSQDQLLSITKTVGEALTLSGSNGQRASNGIIQLAHAFEQGRVQGQTFNAITRDIPVLLLNIAKSLGISITQLKEMVNNGEITGKMLAQLTLNANKFTDSQFAKSIPTLTQAIIVFKNSLVLTVNDLDHATGVMQVFAQAIILIAQNMRTIAPFAIALTAAIVGVRLALLAYTTTTSAAALASALFGNAVLGAQNRLIAARAVFGFFVTGVLLAVTAMHEFGQNVQVSIGPFTNLRQVILFLEIVLRQFASSAHGAEIALVALGTAFLTLRTRLGPLSILVSAVYIALRTLGFSATQAAIGVTVFAGVLLLVQNRAAIAAAAMQVYSFATGEAAIATAALDLALTPVGIALALIAVVVISVATGMNSMGQSLLAAAQATVTLLSHIPGFQTLLDILKQMVSLAWDGLLGALDKMASLLGISIDKLSDAANKAIDMDKAIKDAAKDVQDATDAAGGLADQFGQAAAEAQKLQSAAQGASAAAGGRSGGSATNNVNVNISSGAGSVAVGINGTATAAEAHVQTITNNNSGGGGGSGSGTTAGGGSGNGPFVSELFRDVPVSGVGINPLGGYQSTSSFVRVGSQYGPQDPNKVAAQANAAAARQLALLSSIYDVLKSYNDAGQKLLGVASLSADQLKFIELSTGATKQDIRQVLTDNRKAFETQRKMAELTQKMQEQQQKDAQKAQEQAQKQTEELQKLQQIQQAHDQSLTQALVQALNNKGVDFVSQLDPQVVSIANEIANLNAQLVGISNPIQAAEVQRRIQVLSDSLEKLTKSVDDLNDNPYLKYAQNVYGDATGVQLSSSTSQAAQIGASTGAAVASTILSQSSGGGGGGGNSSHSSSGGGGSSKPKIPSPFYLGAFADGGDIDIGSTGLYAAMLHGGENVRVTKGDSGPTRNININMNVNGVQDADSFRRSKRQILATLYRDLMAVGEQT